MRILYYVYYKIYTLSIERFNWRYFQKTGGKIDHFHKIVLFDERDFNYSDFNTQFE